MSAKSTAILAALAVAASGCLVDRADRAGTGTPAIEAFTAPWFDEDGQPAASDDTIEVQSRVGPDHCDWDSAVFLTVGWPLGTRLQRVGGGGELESRTYVRDAHGAIGQGLARQLRTDTALPDEATNTGYSTDGELELWLGSDQGDDGVYVVGDGITEWWPRGSPGCD